MARSIYKMINNSFIILLGIAAAGALATEGDLDPDIYLNFTQMSTKYGYPNEVHEIHTEDGYILNAFRLPQPNAPVVFVQHGL